MDYRTELNRRIEQFHRYLEPMDRRAHEVYLWSSGGGVYATREASARRVSLKRRG